VTRIRERRSACRFWWGNLKERDHLRLIHTYHAVPMPFPCHAVPLRVYIVSFPFDLHIAAVFDSHMPCHDHAVLKALLKAMAQRGMGIAWHV
jgi:hypothetical protein